jgi:hypothetical protein
MVAMPAEDVLGASAAPELDEYGVPVQPPPKTHAYLRLTTSLASNAIQGAALFVYLRYEHQHSTSGIRVLALAAALIACFTRRWGDTRFRAVRLGPLGRAVMAISTLLLLLTTALLVLEALNPHGLTWCHNACGDGGY